MAHPELEELLNTLLPFAQQMLAKRGEFYPFGATVSASGAIVQLAAYTGNEHPLSTELIDLMTQACRQQVAAGAIRAAGICYDIRTTPPDQKDKTDAICVSLEHQSDDAVDIVMPYKKGWFGKVSYSELFAVARTKTIFT